MTEPQIIEDRYPFRIEKHGDSFSVFHLDKKVWSEIKTEEEARRTMISMLIGLSLSLEEQPQGEDITLE